MTREAQAAMDALDRLLEQERALLLAGEIDQIADVLSAKEALIDTLTAMDRAELQDLTSLQGKLARNQSLLDGALHGLRRTSSRLAALRQVRRSLETYNKAGHKETIDAQVTRKLERRA